MEEEVKKKKIISTSHVDVSWASHGRPSQDDQVEYVAQNTQNADGGQGDAVRVVFQPLHVLVLSGADDAAAVLQLLVIAQDAGWRRDAGAHR